MTRRMKTHKLGLTMFSAIGSFCLIATLSACSAAATTDGDNSGSNTSDQGSSSSESTTDPSNTDPNDDSSLEANVLGTWASDEQGNPKLVFDDAGTVSGTDGCNGIGSTYTVQGDRVLVAPYAATMMACMGVDDWLRGVSEVSVDGDTMQVFNKKGVEIGSLARLP